MDERARILDEAREGLKHPGRLGEQKLQQLADAPPVVTKAAVIARDYYDDADYPDDVLVKHRRGMVRAGLAVEVLPPLKPPALTDAEVLRIERETREALIKYQARTFVDARVAVALDARDEHRDDVHGALVSHERKLWRAKIAALELRLDALAHEVTKRQTIEAGVRRDVVDLPSARRAG